MTPLDAGFFGLCLGLAIGVATVLLWWWLEG